MAELFKNVYNQKFFNKLTNVLDRIISNFNEEKFLKNIYKGDWEHMELKQRMRRVTEVLKITLSSNFEESVKQLIILIEITEQEEIKDENGLGRLAYIFIPDFIEMYGLNHFECSLKAFERITQFISCEFGVRPFIIKYEQKMLDEMYKWATHKNASVRRLATEGCRPRLPWGMAIPKLKKDPAPILPVLELLKTDEEEFVRRSVANNLNDISKDNPSVVMEISKKWIGISKEVDWIIKHANRTLLKNGNQEVLKLFGYGSAEDIKLNNFKIITPNVKIGEYLEFYFELLNTSKKTEKVRLEYGIYFLKKNGDLSKKVFKISEKDYKPKLQVNVSRRQSFKIITTRKFYVGIHKVSIIVNGVEFKEIKEFQLING